MNPPGRNTAPTALVIIPSAKCASRRRHSCQPSTAGAVNEQDTLNFRCGGFGAKEIAHLSAELQPTILLGRGARAWFAGLLHGVKHGEEKILLGRKMVVERAPGYPRLRDQVVGAGGMLTTRAEQMAAGGD
jgi:hypothetical protein